MARRELSKALGATLVGTMDTAALLPVIAFYATALGADLLLTGVIVGLYSAVHAPANILFGRYVDRTGRKRPLAIGLFWDAASLLLYVAASSPLLLVLARISHGIGGGLVGPSSMSLVADTAPAERKGRVMALYGTAIAFGVILGNGLAGPLVGAAGSGRPLQPSDFHYLFFVLAATLVAGGAVALTIREPETKSEPGRFRWAVLRGYLPRANPMAGYFGIFTLYFILGGFVLLVPLHLKAALGYGPRDVAFAFTMFAVLSLLFHYPAGMLADRFGPAGPSLIGYMALAAAMAAIPLSSNGTHVFAAMALFGLGHGFLFSTSSTLVTRAADRENLGVYSGLFYTVLVLGVAIGAPMMGAVASFSTVAIGIWASAWVVFLGIAFTTRALLGTSADAPSPGRPSMEDG